jgi:glutathione transport system substrate-binding protein
VPASVPSLAAALLAVALLASACHAARTFKVGQNDINPVPRSSLQDGGTLNWPIAALPVNYNFNGEAGSSTDELSIVSAVMPTLFRFDATAQPVLDHDYLDSAAVTGAAPQVVTYRINPKATWSNGTPITEADFEAQWRALNGTNKDFRTALLPGYSQIAAVGPGTDAREVLVTFSQPYADWRGLFSPLFPSSLNKDAPTFNNGWVTGTVTSAGPFEFESQDVPGKTVTLVRNPQWWGQIPKLYSIIYHAVGSDPDAQLDALGKGQIDFVGIGPNTSQLEKAKGIKGVVERQAAGPAFRQLTMNGTSPTLSDATVRKALALAVDRPAIAKALLDPLGVAGASLDNHIFMANQHGYQSNAGDLAKADPAKAGALLDQRGWRLAGGVRSREGQPLSVRLVIPDDVAEAGREASLVKTQLKGIGVTVVVQPVPSQQFFDSFVTKGDFDMALFSWQGTVFPISSNYPIYQNPSPPSSSEPGDIHQNYARIGSPAIDALFAKASAELDPQKAIALGNQIDTRVWNEVHSLTLYQRPQLVFEKATLANFGAAGFASPSYEDIGFTKS